MQLSRLLEHPSIVEHKPAFLISFSFEALIPTLTFLSSATNWYFILPFEGIAEKEKKHKK
jgi:hypothetical protein